MTDTPAALRFTEKMTGWFHLGATSFETGLVDGEADASPLTFVLTIDIPDVDAAIADPSLPAPLHGYVEAPALSPDRIDVPSGTFRLMVPEPDQVQASTMRYSMELVTTDRRRLQFDGHKNLHHDSILKMWPATTTLYVTISESGIGIGRGIIIIKPLDFARQLRTMRVTGVRGRRRRIATLAAFGRGFFGRLTPLYAGELATAARFAPDATPPDGRRATRLPVGAACWCDASGAWLDGTSVGPDAWLKLTRYQGGTRGPLLLAAGFAMEAHSFATPTISTTLAEFAVERGYDVWLFDYRASNALPTATSAFTIDEVAMADWPAAVAEVRRRTGAHSVQVLGHCVGSLSILMAVLGGLDGVRSIVCSQFTVHPATSRLNRTKNALHVGDAMRWLHLRTVAPNAKPTFTNKLMDRALVVLPVPKGERCGRPVCRWLNAIFGLTHAHGQLNDATHESFDEAFGYANVKGLRHLSRISRSGAAVDAAGRDVYLPNVDRLAMPILFVQGARNHIFRPAGTARTVAWLSEANDPSLYETLLLPEYAHLDAMVGKDAPTDVFPGIFAHLDRFNEGAGSDRPATV